MEALISEEYGLEDGDDMSDASKAKIKVNGNSAKKSLTKLYDGIEIPKAVDWEASRTELKDSWGEPVKEIIDGIKSLELTDEFSFEVTDAMKKGMVETAINELLASQTKVSENAAADVAGKVRSKILEKNFDSIVKALSNDMKEKAKAEMRKEVHNDEDLNSDTRTETDKGEAMSGADFFKSL